MSCNCGSRSAKKTGFSLNHGLLNKRSGMAELDNAIVSHPRDTGSIIGIGRKNFLFCLCHI
jgi:hypothetical protein